MHWNLFHIQLVMGQHALTRRPMWPVQIMTRLTHWNLSHTAGSTFTDPSTHMTRPNNDPFDPLKSSSHSAGSWVDIHWLMWPIDALPAVYCVHMVFRSASAGDPQQDPSHREDGACIPGPPVRTTVVFFGNVLLLLLLLLLLFTMQLVQQYANVCIRQQTHIPKLMTRN